VSESLRDQLLKSGLAKKLREDAKPVVPKAAPARKPPAPSREKKAGDVDLARAYALRARVEKDERERAQREAERVARERKESKQKLATLLEGKAQNAADADLPRHFPHGKKIRRVYCTAGQLARLNNGDLAVVQLGGHYLLVAREMALQARAIQPESLVLLCDPSAPPEDDVPPDLVW
jgi:uncharacterized protein